MKYKNANCVKDSSFEHLHKLKGLERQNVKQIAIFYIGRVCHLKIREKYAASSLDENKMTTFIAMILMKTTTQFSYFITFVMIMHFFYSLFFTIMMMLAYHAQNDIYKIIAKFSRISNYTSTLFLFFLHLNVKVFDSLRQHHLQK